MKNQGDFPVLFPEIQWTMYISQGGRLYDDDKITYKDEDGENVDNVIWDFIFKKWLAWPCICCMSGRFRYKLITVWRIIG